MSGGLLIQLAAGDVAVLHDNILLVADASTCKQHGPDFEVLPGDDGSMKLPNNAVALSALLDLQPHGVRFPKPVLLILPVCAAAAAADMKAWRSLEDGGWEELKSAKFSAGHAILRLEHFCRVVAGTDGPLQAAVKISCYMNTRFDTRWVISKVGCDRCKQLLDDYLNDEEFLQGYEMCRRPCPLGTYAEGDALRLFWPDADASQPAEPGKVKFGKFPCMSLEPWTSPEPRVELKIEDDNEVRRHTFRHFVEEFFSPAIIGEACSVTTV